MSEAYDKFVAAEQRHRAASRKLDRIEQDLHMAQRELREAGEETDAAWSKYMEERKAALLSQDGAKP